MTNNKNKSLFSSFIFIVIGIIAVIFLITNVRSMSNGNYNFNIKVMLTSAENIFSGTYVTYAGKTIGKVSKIDYHPLIGPDGTQYYYEATITICNKIKIKDNDTISSNTNGILGEKVLNISPSSEKSSIVKKNHRMFSKSDKSIKDATNSAVLLVDKANSTISSVQTIMEQNSENIKQSINNIKYISEYINDLSKNFKEQNIVSHIALINKTVDLLTKNMQEALNTLNSRDAWSNISSILENIKSISDSVSAIVSDCNENDKKTIINMIANFSELLMHINQSINNHDNKSLIYYILKNGELYEKTLEVLARINSLVYDINKYGVFFTSSRSWQRERLNNLKQPMP